MRPLAPELFVSIEDPGEGVASALGRWAECAARSRDGGGPRSLSGTFPIVRVDSTPEGQLDAERRRLTGTMLEGD